MFLWSPLSFAQTNVLSVAPPEKLIVKAGAVASAKLTVQLRPGYHCNSNKPSEDYLIPLKLTWVIQQGTPAPLEVADVTYPQPRLETYSFSKQPLSVYSGDFEIVTKFKVPASAAVTCPRPIKESLPRNARANSCPCRMHSQIRYVKQKILNRKHAIINGNWQHGNAGAREADRTRQCRRRGS